MSGIAQGLRLRSFLDFPPKRRHKGSFARNPGVFLGGRADSDLTYPRRKQPFSARQSSTVCLAPPHGPVVLDCGVFSLRRTRPLGWPTGPPRDSPGSPFAPISRLSPETAPKGELCAQSRRLFGGPGRVRLDRREKWTPSWFRSQAWQANCAHTTGCLANPIESNPLAR